MHSPPPRECIVPAMRAAFACPTVGGGGAFPQSQATATVGTRAGGARSPQQRRRPMWGQRALATLVLILPLLLPLGAAAADPPGPTTRALTRAPGLPLAGVAEVVHQVN